MDEFMMMRDMVARGWSVTVGPGDVAGEVRVVVTSKDGIGFVFRGPHAGDIVAEAWQFTNEKEGA